MRALALALLCAAATAKAEEGFPLDFPMLFALHEAEVMQATPGVRRLELPGPVIVEERPEGYVASDMSGRGAVGCAFALMLEALVYGAQCRAVLDDSRKTRLEAMLRRTASFVAANTVPPIPPEEAEPRLRAEIRALTEARAGEYDCAADVPENHGMIIVTLALTAPDFEQRLDRMLDLPRLPVSNPCL